MGFDTSGAVSGAASGSAFGPWGAVIGGLAGGLLSKQKAPKTVPFKPVDAQEEQRRALAGNIGAEGDIEQLLSRANAFTQDQASGLMERAVPGYAKIAGRFMDQANGLLTNPYGVPDEVGTNLTRIAAERGLSTGVRGEAGDFSLLRDFGINSLQFGNSRISQAQSILQTVAGLAPRVNPMSPYSFYITPQQQVTTAGNNNAGAQGTTQAGENANAAAGNANASMWGNIVANAAGVISGYDWKGKKAPSSPSGDINV